MASSSSSDAINKPVTAAWLTQEVATEPLNSEDDADMDIDNRYSEEIPDGDDVDLNRAE